MKQKEPPIEPLAIYELQLAVVEDDLDDHHVFLLPIDCNLNARFPGKRVSSSPLFSPPPYYNGSFDLPQVAYVAFFYHPKAFEAISGLPELGRKGIWFSQGLASIILVTSSVKDIEKLKTRWEGELRALETWTVASSKITKIHTWKCPPVSFDREKFDITEVDGLDVDTLQLIRQIKLGLADIVILAAQYTPWLLVTFERIIHDLNKVIGAIPPLLSSARSAKGTEKQVQVLNHSVNLLVQFNSTLAYVTSQCFGGCPLVLQNPCLIAGHSLLGTGTGYQALARFARYIENVLETYPVTQVIKKEYGKRHGAKLNDDENEWEKLASLGIDIAWEDYPPVPVQHKIVYFSARLGFGEFHYHVTAAAQALHAGDSARWSLMTLSHEMMHAHVSGILAAIFTCENANRTAQHFFSLFKAHFCEGTQSEESSNQFINSLQTYILNYSVERPAFLSIAREAAAGNDATGETLIRPKNDEELLSAFRIAFRFLNEVFVHVLDLFYVYNGQQDIYLDLVWESWMTVPAVADNLRDYTLRSLIAIGSQETGDPLTGPFPAALRKLQASLSRLNTRHNGNGLFHRVSNFLEDKANIEWLKAMFSPSYYLARVILRFLASGEVQKKLSSNDGNLIINEDDATLGYDLETGAFTGIVPNNPVAFLRDRLRKLTTDAPSHLSELYRTTWIHLVMASATCDVKR